MSTSTLDVSTALAALYLPGGPKPFEPVRRMWLGVEHVLRTSGPSTEALRRAGFRQEAMLLSSTFLWQWAREQVRTSACLAANDDRYPARWLEILGSSAPPAFWMSGDMPVGPFLSVVGSRRVGRADLSFAEEVGARAASLGFALASGAAAGCDTASMRRAGERAVEILPRGLRPGDERHGRCRLSARPPGEEFTSAAAMERNGLIYSIGTHAVVVHARFNEGGTWVGAQTALRRRLCTVVVRVRKADLASSALVALGGVPLDRPEDLAGALARRTDALLL